MTRPIVELLRAIDAVKVLGDGRLKLVAPKALPDELVARARQLKRELLDALGSAPRTPTAERGRDAVKRDERAAILEYDGGLSRAWADLLARLRREYPPSNLAPNDWRPYADTCHRLADHWAPRIAELGWSPETVLGWNGRGLYPYMARASLPWLLAVGGYTLLELNEHEAIATSTASRRRVLRRVDRRLELIWRLDN